MRFPNLSCESEEKAGVVVSEHVRLGLEGAFPSSVSMA
jgi:hypothetical protein